MRFYSHIVFLEDIYEQNNNLFVCAFNGCEEMCLRCKWLIINDLVGGVIIVINCLSNMI